MLVLVSVRHGRSIPRVACFDLNVLEIHLVTEVNLLVFVRVLLPFLLHINDHLQVWPTALDLEQCLTQLSEHLESFVSVDGLLWQLRFYEALLTAEFLEAFAFCLAHRILRITHPSV